MLAPWAVPCSSLVQRTSSTTSRHAPVAVGLASVSAVSAGGFGSLAARTDATVATWGYNAYGQL
ncbi:MAG: hypothetical protein AB1673_17535, partial [Actinomycetota bacterium]